MTNISKRKIDSDDYKKAETALVTYIGSLSKRTAGSFVGELLTESEQIMITKRYAAILMLHNNFSTYRTCRVLSLSLSTTQRILKSYQAGEYEQLVGKISRHETNEFLDLIKGMLLAKADPQARTRMMKRHL